MGGGKTLVKYTGHLNRYNAMGEFGNVCAKGKHTFLIPGNPTLRIHWKDVFALVGDEVRINRSLSYTVKGKRLAII